MNIESLKAKQAEAIKAAENAKRIAEEVGEEIKKLEKRGNWPEKIELGMLFERDGIAYMVGYSDKRIDNGDIDLITVRGGTPGKRFVAGGMFYGHDSEFTYLGHARDLLTIKMPEPTGEELVGRVCDFSDDGVNWSRMRVCECFIKSATFPYRAGVIRYKFARLAH
jgi:hypothetical protein